LTSRIMASGLVKEENGVYSIDRDKLKSMYDTLDNYKKMALTLISLSQRDSQ